MPVNEANPHTPASATDDISLYPKAEYADADHGPAVATGTVWVKLRCLGTSAPMYKLCPKCPIIHIEQVKQRMPCSLYHCIKHSGSMALALFYEVQLVLSGNKRQKSIHSCYDQRWMKLYYCLKPLLSNAVLTLRSTHYVLWLQHHKHLPRR